MLKQEKMYSSVLGVGTMGERMLEDVIKKSQCVILKSLEMELEVGGGAFLSNVVGSGSFSDWLSAVFVSFKR